MSSPRIGRTGLRSPRGWLFVAFLGVSLYLASQLLRLYPARVAEIVVLPAAEVKEILALASGLGQLLFFGGLVAALWRANLAAGVSNAGIPGLAFRLAGGRTPGVVEVAPFPRWLRAGVNPTGVVGATPGPRPPVSPGAAPPVPGPA